MAQVTSKVRDRGRVFSLAAVLAASAALVSAPAAMGVDGDPIKTSVFKFKLSGAFKKQLKRNGVKMKPKTLSIDTRGTSDVDPSTGAADLRLKKIVFKKGKEKVSYTKLSATLPGKVKSSSEGGLFKLTQPKVARNGFGADLTGVKVKFLKSAAKKLNKRLGLNSLKKGNVGTVSLSYQPATLKVLSGTAQTFGSTAAGSVGIKFISHCVLGLTPGGIDPIAPATKSGTTFTFPVVGGEISPTGDSGLTQQGGGLRIAKNITAGACATSPYGELTQQQIETNVTARSISSVVNIVASPCAPGFACSPGDKGRAVGQTTDPANTVVTADPANKTIKVTGSVVRLAPVSAATLNAVFPNTSGDPANDFQGGDPFGTSALTVQVR